VYFFDNVFADTRVKPAQDELGARRAMAAVLADAGNFIPRPPLSMRHPSRRHRAMKTQVAIFAIATLAIVAAAPADAKGCLKGAAVGGVAGHYAGHHGVLGAIAGCAYGRHEANQKDRQQDQQRQTPTPAGQEKL
jgi:hypothetical protein